MIFGVTPAYITHLGVLHVRMRLACKMCVHKQDVDFWEVTVNYMSIEMFLIRIIGSFLKNSRLKFWNRIIGEI